MINIFLDPIIFAFPYYCKNSTDFENYITELFAWREFTQCNYWANVTVPQNIEEVLTNTSSYPQWHDLTSILKKCNLQASYQPKDIVNVISGLLKKLGKTEKNISISDLLWDNFDCSNQYSISNVDSLFVESLQRILVIMSMTCYLRTIPDKHCILISKLNNGESPFVVISFELLDIESSREDLHVPIPLKRENSFLHTDSNKHICDLVNSKCIWKFAKKNDDYFEAIKRHLINRTGREINVVSKMRFGDCFLSTAISLHFLEEDAKIGNILDALSDLALGEKIHTTHPLRTSFGGSSPQRVRNKDNAKAWRKDIDYEYHIHYWVMENGMIEIASVVSHNDFSIPE